jgi:molybdopterin molybdotransferase
MQEDMRAEGDTIHLSAPLELVVGRHVRKTGEDFTSGDLLVSAGDQMTPARIALAAMGGHGEVSVRRPIRVAILSTGDELVPPGAPTQEDQIPASNSVMLQALLTGPACETTDCGIVRDDLATLTDTFRSLSDADIILSTGGASVGDHDHVKPALEAAGAHIDFWKIAMRPGKPLMAGQLGPALVLGLPGNPVSAFVTATLFAKPLIAALSGVPSPLPDRQKAVLGAGLPAVAKRTDHVRAILENGRATPIGLNDSAALLRWPAPMR